MALKPTSNTASRRQALQVMFQQEFLGFDLADLNALSSDLLVVSIVPRDVKDTDLVGEPINDYTRALLKGVVEHLADIDAWICDTAQNWTIDRMLNVDRNIIRLATYEMVYCDQVPTGVAINEAVEIARMFGGDESPKFVNGVLGRIASRMEEGTLEEGAGAAQEEPETQDEPIDADDAVEAEGDDAEAVDFADAAIDGSGDEAPAEDEQ